MAAASTAAGQPSTDEIPTGPAADCRAPRLRQPLPRFGSKRPAVRIHRNFRTERQGYNRWSLRTGGIASPRSVPVQVVCGCGHQYDKQANRGSASDPRALLSFSAGCVAVPSRVAARIVATVLQDRVCRRLRGSDMRDDRHDHWQEDAAERDRKGRFSARRKRATVLRLLRGEDLESVPRELGITAARASQWRDRFLAAGRTRDQSRDALAGTSGRRATWKHGPPARYTSAWAEVMAF